MTRERDDERTRPGGSDRRAFLRLLGKGTFGTLRAAACYNCHLSRHQPLDKAGKAHFWPI